MPTVLHDIAWRAMQVHGALGVSNEMPFSGMMLGANVMGLADGPTEVHKVTVARQVLRDYRPSDDLWPTEHRPRRWPPPARSWPSTSSTRWGTCDRPRPARGLAGRAGPARRGEPVENSFVSGGSQNEIYEIRRGDLHGALRIPPPDRAREPGRGDPARVAHHRGARPAPTCPTRRRSPPARTPRCWAGPST